MSYRKCWNVAGALVSPNGITQYSKCPNRVRNAVFHSSPCFMRRRLYAPLRSNLEKRRALRKVRKWSSIRGKGCQFFTVSWLRPR